MAQLQFISMGIKRRRLESLERRLLFSNTKIISLTMMHRCATNAGAIHTEPLYTHAGGGKYQLDRGGVMKARGLSSP